MSLIFGIWIGYAIVVCPVAMFVIGALLVPMDSYLPKLSKLGNLVFFLFVVSLIPGMVFWAGLAVIAFTLLKVVGKIGPRLVRES